MEQCSSEATARYKAEHTLADDSSRAAVKTSQSFVDLTGGFGVDFSYMSRGFASATYVERQTLLCEIARHNFQRLGMTNATVVCASAEDYLRDMQPVDCLYLDPARRDDNGRKTYAITDCTPDVVTLLPLLRQKARRIVLKLSPMLDHREAVRQLAGVGEVHIVSVGNECKELLLVIDADGSAAEQPPRLICVNDENVFIAPWDDPAPLPIADDIRPGMTLCVPNASVMKGGCFGALCRRFDVAAVGINSHLYVSKNADFIDKFPGRQFHVMAITGMGKRDLRTTLSGISCANIAVRNFPLSADALRSKLKLLDGGDIYIFGTTVGREHRIIVCRK